MKLPPRKRKTRKRSLKALTGTCVLKGLLHGKYSCLAKRRSHRKAEWCVYAGIMNPVQYIGGPTYNMIRDLLREEKKTGVMRLDLRKVRSLHGNAWLKKLYKKNLKEKHEQK